MTERETLELLLRNPETPVGILHDAIMKIPGDFKCVVYGYYVDAYVESFNTLQELSAFRKGIFTGTSDAENPNYSCTVEDLPSLESTMKEKVVQWKKWMPDWETFEGYNKEMIALRLLKAIRGGV